MNAKRLEHALEVALEAIEKYNRTDPAEERARAFVAYLTGALKCDDEVLSNRIFTVLHPDSEETAK